jgi:hypothetical protein
MTMAQRWLMVAALALIALILSLYLLHFGAQPSFLPGMGFEPQAAFLEFGEYPDIWGVYSAFNHGEYVSLVGGIIVPLALLAVGAFLVLGAKRSAKVESRN